MKKKLIVLVVLLMIVSLAFPLSAVAATNITMEINGAKVVPDSDPFIVDGVTMVPLRFVGDPIGAALAWDNDTKTATFAKGDMWVQITLGSKTALVKGVPKTMLKAAVAKNGRIFMPLRFVTEGLGATVNWISSTKKIEIYFSDLPMTYPSVTGYYYTSASCSPLQTNINMMTDVVHFAYEVNADGSISDKSTLAADKFLPDGMNVAKSAAKNTLLLFTTKNRDASDTMLASAQTRATAIAKIVNLVKNNGYDGVDLDFETVSTFSRVDYVSFVKELKAALGSSYTLSLSLMPKTNDKQTWLNGYDYASLAKYADRCVVMLYNEHYSGSQPGPVASTDWYEETIQYMLQYIPAEKFHAGLGSYGYSWPVAGGKGTAVRMTAAQQIAAQYGIIIQRDAASGVPWFRYTKEDGIEYIVWFEDSVSLAQKAAIAKKYDLAGIAVWRIDFMSGNDWQAIRNAFL